MLKICVANSIINTLESVNYFLLCNSITCNGYWQIPTKHDAKILCHNRCEIWYCTKCGQISDTGYTFLSSVQAEDMAWFCKSCIQPAMVALLEDKSIEDKAKEYAEKLNQRIKEVENTNFEKLQKKVGELEGVITKIQGKGQGGGSWTDICSSEKRTVKLIKKSLKDRENERMKDKIGERTLSDLKS